MRFGKLASRTLVVSFITIAALCLSRSISTQAQSLTTSVVGSVLDAGTGAPIENASVSVIGAETTRAVTDASGNFVAANVPVADPFLQVTITIAATGYGSWTMRDTPLYPDVTRTIRVLLTQQDQFFTDALPRALIGGIQSPADVSLVPRAPLYYSDTTPPATIRVAITGQTSCVTGPVLRVDTVDFREYAKNVLPHEWIASWGNNAPDSLRAGAMAVKMFAWWRVNIGGRPAQNADVLDNTCDQVYIPNTKDSRTDAAVDLTWYYRMRQSSQVIEIHYAATSTACQSSYQPCMPQWHTGTYEDALNGMSWQAILHKYYDPVQIDGFGYWYYIPMIRK